MDYEQCIKTKDRFETLCNEKRNFSMVWVVNNKRTTLEVRFYGENTVYFYLHTGSVNIEFRSSGVGVEGVDPRDEYVFVSAGHGYIAIHGSAEFHEMGD